MRKSDAFKGELPLCMFLLNDAILIMKEDAECNVRHQMFKKNCEKNNGGTNNNKKEKDYRDKKYWTSFGTLIRWKGNKTRGWK
ncbi:hypothetical protein PRUPE_4G176800 [Prunus persica]|uniref:HHO5-like N-terminal domain-containing protein n=1 Tax=Prunus persica TaxID=3760 RepID=A0A251PM42_PRUPE|nr:hypothetical protein PRUPE_4G176800 [Prunus persica]